jgi:hypothetical protein
MIHIALDFDPVSGSLDVNAPMGDHVQKALALYVLTMAGKVIHDFDPARSGGILLPTKPFPLPEPVGR